MDWDDGKPACFECMGAGQYVERGQKHECPTCIGTGRSYCERCCNTPREERHWFCVKCEALNRAEIEVARRLAWELENHLRLLLLKGQPLPKDLPDVQTVSESIAEVLGHDRFSFHTEVRDVA